MTKEKPQRRPNSPDVEEKIRQHKRSSPGSETSAGAVRMPTSNSAAGPGPELVFIPGGSFTMGGDPAGDRYAYPNESPRHRVALADFYIGRYPVTNAEYGRFLEATGHRMPPHLVSRFKPMCEPNHPVVWVSWQDAVAYCKWLSGATGYVYRLPTEAEWEKAARGTDGRAYPWGDEPPDKSRCAFANDVGATTTPVGQYSPQGDSPYGCADMAGNVWEWCHSLYMPYPYDPEDGREDPGTDGLRVLRGGAFYTNLRRVRCASRIHYFPHLWLNVIGFRVTVADLPANSII